MSQKRGLRALIRFTVCKLSISEPSKSRVPQVLAFEYEVQGHEAWMKVKYPGGHLSNSISKTLMQRVGLNLATLSTLVTSQPLKTLETDFVPAKSSSNLRGILMKE